MYKIIMVSPGGVKRDLHGGFNTESEAAEYAADLNWEYCDENGFVWRLDVAEDEYYKEYMNLCIPRVEWAKTFLEFCENGDDQALLYLCDVMENTFNRTERLRFKAIRDLVDAALALNRIVALMEYDEIPMNLVVEEAYRNIMGELHSLARSASDIV